MHRAFCCARQASKRNHSMNSWTSRSVHWKASAPAPLKNSETFSAQSKLPRLPVPELKSTLSTLKESLKPIAWTEEEYQTSLRKIEQFELGLGPELQKRLEQRAANTDHWLEEWWDGLGYLGYRDSVSVFPQLLHSSPSWLPGHRQRFILLSVIVRSNLSWLKIHRWIR